LVSAFFCLSAFLPNQAFLPSQAKPSQAKPSQAKPSQAKPSQGSPIIPQTQGCHQGSQFKLKKVSLAQYIFIASYNTGNFL
jgi:hypothetical protein